MSEQTIQRVFHEFTARFSKDFFPRHVKFPEGADRERVLEEYADVGFPGCIGSADCTHVRWMSAPNSARHSYKGKEGYTTVAFEAVCDHNLRCLGCTGAYPGAMNDKTIVRFDKYIQRVRDDCKDVEYKLLDKNGDEFVERGLYVIVDGGYQNVSGLRKRLQ